MHSTVENLQILYQDNHIIIINKRAGDIVQGDKTKDTPLSDIVKAYIKKEFNKPNKVFLGTVHRLDRPTSGIVIFAKTSKALERLNKMFKEKNIHKTYWAIVKNKPNKDQDTLKNWLKKNPKKNKSFAYDKQVKDSKYAILHYKTIKRMNNYSLLEINLETGRHHQIRCQLSNIGSSIKGDLKYNAPRSNKDGSIHLHARKIKFIHPVSKIEINITAQTPEDKLWNLCKE